MTSQDEIKRHLKTFLGDVRRDVIYNTVNDDARIEELLQILTADGVVIKKSKPFRIAGEELFYTVESLIGG